MKTEADKPARAGLPAHERVYRELRDLILFGVLEPGEPVTIQGLVDRLGAGMTPVREGLRRLTAEGALSALGNRRIMVPILEAKDVDELTEARLALEPRLASRAAQRITPAQVDQLRVIDDRLDHAIDRGDVHSYLFENYEFHKFLNGVADAPVMTSMVTGLWLRFGPSLRIVCGQTGTRSQPDLHKDILTALIQNDGDAAAQAMVGDVSQGMELIAQSL